MNMKNFLVVCAFALCTFAFTNVNAQCSGGKKSANASCDKPKTEVNANDNTKPDAKTVGTTDKKDKKCCSGDKANANTSDKKDKCCSKKETRKEESK
jgi:hypothetical protein